MTATDDAASHVQYFRALMSLGMETEHALAMTIAYIQTEAMRQIPEEPPTRPKPTRVK